MEYHKIETLYERDDKFKVQPGKFKNRCYDLLKQWEWTEKIDGTNIRATWDGKSLTVGGRSDNAQIPGDLVAYLYKAVDPKILGDIFQGNKAVIYGEGYGPGIQKGGGLYSSSKKFIVFDVLVEDKWWLNWENVKIIAGQLSLDTVPYLGFMTLEQATEKARAGFQSCLNGGQAKSEGLVGRPEETLFDKGGKRLIVKLKTKDF